MAVALRNQQGNPIAGFEEELPAPQPSPSADPYASAMVDDDPYEAAKVGEIPNTENFLQKAIKAAQGGSQGFFDSYTLGATKLARYAGDMVANKIAPLPPEAEQDFQNITEGDPNAYAVGASVPIARGAQQLAGAGMNALFGKQLAKKALPKASGKLTKSIQEIITKSKANPKALGVPKDEVIKVLKGEFSKAKVPSGEQAATFKRWIKALEDPKKFPDMLDAETVSQIETVFGKAAKFGLKSNDPVLQQSAKGVRKYASDRMDLLAEKAGVPQFIKQSADKSKLLRRATGKSSFMENLFKKGVEGGVMGSAGTAAYNLFKKES